MGVTVDLYCLSGTIVQVLDNIDEGGFEAITMGNGEWIAMGNSVKGISEIECEYT